MDNKKSNIAGIVGTIAFHVILIVVLLIFAFTPPAIEFPEPEGIAVEFGELVEGIQASQPEVNQQIQPEQEASPAESRASSQVQQVSTQTTTDAITINQTKPTPQEKTPELTPEQQEALKKLQEQEEFKKRQAALANQNLSGNPGNSNEGDKTNPGSPQGTDSQKNTKGSPGNPLGNKDALYIAKPVNTTNCNKPIELTVRLNSQGGVSAIIDIETALGDQSCIEAAKRAALQNKFPSDPSREVRYAKITYDYTISQK